MAIWVPSMTNESKENEGHSGHVYSSLHKAEEKNEAIWRGNGANSVELSILVDDLDDDFHKDKILDELKVLFHS